MKKVFCFLPAGKKQKGCEDSLHTLYNVYLLFSMYGEKEAEAGHDKKESDQCRNDQPVHFLIFFYKECRRYLSKLDWPAGIIYYIYQLVYIINGGNGYEVKCEGEAG